MHLLDLNVPSDTTQPLEPRYEASQEDESEAFQEAIHEDGEGCSPEKCPIRPDARWDPAVVPCFRPLDAYWSAEIGPTGKRQITFKRSEAFQDLPFDQVKLTLPCGRCVGCRLERSRQWAVRCMHEASLHDRNCFITLTYNDAHLPEDSSLKVRDFQLFMKRLRKYARPTRLKVYYCGEYGAERKRPHFHAILFNWDFDDRRFWKKTRSGALLDRSPTLERLWSVEGQSIGYSSVGSVTFESAAYVARYVMKKRYGDDQEDHYIDEETGVVRTPEFAHGSNGIAKEWFKQFGGDVYPHDFVVARGVKFKPPRYYDGLYEILDPEGFRAVKAKRRMASDRNPQDQTVRRLGVREKVAEERLSRLKRELPDDET